MSASECTFAVAHAQQDAWQDAATVAVLLVKEFAISLQTKKLAALLVRDCPISIMLHIAAVYGKFVLDSGVIKSWFTSSNEKIDHIPSSIVLWARSLLG